MGHELADKYHFIGIGGIGMSGLARILVQNGIGVTGSDISKNEMTLELETLKVPIAYGHDSKNVPKEASLVISSSVGENNCELSFAKKGNYPILHRSDLLHLLMNRSKSLLVAGTHGKTTTTSLLTSVFIKANRDPTYAIGGVLRETGWNANKGQGEYFIAEADESDGTFLKYTPFGAILTNIDDDHLDYYKDEEALCGAFKSFASKVYHPKFLFYCNDDNNLRRLNISGVSYGFSSPCELQGYNFCQKGDTIFFDISFDGLIYENIQVNLKGIHNALNALAVFGMAIRAGIDEKTIREAFSTFNGVKRRAEFLGESQSIRVIDDYAHHPTEIEVTLKGLKEAYPNRRLVVLFQPHRYTRVKHCLDNFASCFSSADELFITDIYSAGETPIDGISAQNIVSLASKKLLIPIHYFPKEHLIDSVLGLLRPFDVVAVLGAGDINREGQKLLKEISQHPLKPIRCALVFGGRSTEHEISLQSAQNIVLGLDPKFYTVFPFYISKKGHWTQGEEAHQVLKSAKAKELKTKEILPAAVLATLSECEIAFPMLHGPNGEDGTIQGMFDMLSMPYVGCNHRASAIAMNKAVTKKLAESQNLAVAPYVHFSMYDWKHKKDAILDEIGKRLSFPLYIKPVHLGSTIGVKKIEKEEELNTSIAHAFSYDEELLVETGIAGRELEFSVFGNGFLQVFPPGEIMNHGAIYDYSAKYGNFAFQTKTLADLEERVSEKGMLFAKRAYESVGCDGYARVDCFLDEKGEFILNEINPIPGFTANSLFPKMCATHGTPLKDLLNELISWGFERFRRRSKQIYDYARVKS